MKNLIFGLLMLVLTSTVITAQSTPHDHGFCGTVSNEFQKERIKANKKYASEHDVRSETIYLPIKFHRVGTTQGTEQVKVSSVLDQMCRLRREYAKYDIIPYISNGFNDVFNSGIFFDPIGNNGQIENNKSGSAVDVFITENADTSNSVPGDGTTLGFYAVPFGNSGRDYIVVRKKEVIDSTETLEHELGHYLSLDHTFDGWEGVQYNQEVHGNPLTVSVVGGNAIELVDRDSNCETAGDQLCDTPADYNFNFSFENTDSDLNNDIVAGCNMVETIRDSEGKALSPMTNNIMSYYTCPNQKFTDGQVGLMMADFNSSARTHINSNYVPNLNEVTEIPTLVSPGSMAPIYNGIVFEWTAVEHADFYSLEISSSSESFNYITTQPSAFITDLSPDETYFWLVAPFNETSGCGRTSPKVLITGGDATSVESLNDLAEFYVFPNPINQGASLQVQITSKESFTADLTILSLEGKEVLVQKGKEIKTNNNLLEISTESLTSGMYILQVRSEKGVFSKQIVIK